MEQYLIKKINGIFTEFSYRESEVVYVLVEIRKFLDLIGEKANYKSLYFYCNWVVHFYLDRKEAESILLNLEKSLSSMSPHSVMPDNVVRFVNLTQMTGELQQFLSDYHISSQQVEWMKFREALANHLLNCPLVVRRNDMVRQFTISNVTDGHICYEIIYNDGKVIGGAHPI